MRVLEDLEDRKKALEKALEMTSKPSNYGQNIQHKNFLIDWLKTEKNGEKQLAQPRKNSRNNGNKQRLIQAMKENKRKSRNVIVFTDHFFMIIIIIINLFLFFTIVLTYIAYRLQLAAWLHCN